VPGLDPGIHVLLDAHKKDVDGRDKPGHDDKANYDAAFAAARPAFLPENKHPPRNVPSSER